MFKLLKNSLAFNDGQSDELSYQTCKILLGSPKKHKSVEIIYATGAVFSQKCIFTLGGAHYAEITLNGINIEQNKVYQANKNDVLKFLRHEQGFRLYLMASFFDKKRLGYSRGKFEDYFSLPKDKIRLIKGPEYHYLKNPQTFLEQPFMISANSDLSGLRLEGTKMQARQYDIISSIVDDGTIQLTPSGPIVLLRQRQITGGYPRIFSVVKTDLDFLAQYKMGLFAHFELIPLKQAKNLLLQREKQLENLKNTCHFL